MDWWLDSVCTSGEWEVLLYWEDPNIVAVLPYFVRSKGPFTYVTMPVFTKFMGPFFLIEFSEKKQQKIVGKLIAALPDFDGFAQTLHYQINNWLPYRWAGYSQTAYYSYQLEEIEDLDRVWSEIDVDYRNNKMTKARQVATVEEDLQFDLLHQMISHPFDRQLLSKPFRKDQLQSIYHQIQERKCGKSFYARDAQGQVIAAILLVWDQDCCYLLLAGENEFARNHGVGIYTIWKGIEYASKQLRVNTFDFLGGMAENLERTRRQFGAKQITYFYIQKMTFWFRLIKKLSAIYSR